MKLENVKETGSVFTKDWIVQLMMKISGFFPLVLEKPFRIIEPSCGYGSFAFPIVNQLISAAKKSGVDFRLLGDSFAAYDINPDAIEFCREKSIQILISNGCDLDNAIKLTSKWFVCGDYLLSSQKDVDLVIGNPPYVRPSNQDNKKRSEYEKVLSFVTPGTDLFIGFLEKGIKSLSSGGKLCFICADRWMQNSYGKKLRKFIASGFNMDLILKMSGVQAFDSDVDAYPSIIVISRNGQDTLYGGCSSSFGPRNVQNLLGSIAAHATAKNDGLYFLSPLPKSAFLNDNWALSTGNIVRLIQKLEMKYPKMEEDGVNLGIGVATGNDSIYVIDDPSICEKSRIVPLLKARDITSRILPKAPKHWLVNPWSDDGTLINLENFPKTAAYFEKNRDALCNRHTAKKDLSKWYRTIDKVKISLTKAKKLLITDMLQEPEPIYDPGLFYPHHNLYWITSDHWDLKVLGGILYSEIASLFVSSYGVKMRYGTMRFEAQYLKMIHIPRYDDISDELRKRLSEAFEKRDRVAATEAAFDAYRLSGEEREAILDEHKG